MQIQKVFEVIKLSWKNKCQRRDIILTYFNAKSKLHNAILRYKESIFVWRFFCDLFWFVSKYSLDAWGFYFATHLYVYYIILAQTNIVPHFRVTIWPNMVTQKTSRDCTRSHICGFDKNVFKNKHTLLYILSICVVKLSIF